MFEILLDPSAEQDVDGIFKWYERQREGLGFEFLISFNNALEVLAQNPHANFNTIQSLKVQYKFMLLCINIRIRNNGK